MLPLKEVSLKGLFQYQYSAIESLENIIENRKKSNNFNLQIPMKTFYIKDNMYFLMLADMYVSKTCDNSGHEWILKINFLGT